LEWAGAVVREVDGDGRRTRGARGARRHEPGGVAAVLYGDLIFAPDWKPLKWNPENVGLGFELWGSPAPETYFTYGSPVRPAARVSGALAR